MSKSLKYTHIIIIIIFQLVAGLSKITDRNQVNARSGVCVYVSRVCCYKNLVFLYLHELSYNTICIQNCNLLKGDKNTGYHLNLTSWGYREDDVGIMIVIVFILYIFYNLKFIIVDVQLCEIRSS